MEASRMRLSDLMTAYETALDACGLGYATRLRLLQRATTLVRRHEQQGTEYLDSKIISDYFQEVDDHFYSSGIGKKYNRVRCREATRFLWFAQTGEIRLPNPLQGARQELTPAYARIAETYSILRNASKHT